VDEVEIAHRLEEMIAAESESLSVSLKNLMPGDLIKVETTAQLFSTGVKEECYMTSSCHGRLVQ